MLVTTQINPAMPTIIILIIIIQIIIIIYAGLPSTKTGAPVIFPACYYNELLTLPQGKGGGFIAKNILHRLF